MSSRRALLLAALLATVPARAPRAQEAAPVLPPVPEAVELAVPETPVRVPAAEAARLMERLTTEQAPPPAAPAAPSAGVTETIVVDPPVVVNPTAQFIFQDATDRTAASRRVIPMAERRSVVEVLRQTLAASRRSTR